MLSTFTVALMVLGWAPMLVRLRAARPGAAPRLDRGLLVVTWIVCMLLTAASAWDATRALPHASRRVAAGIALQWLAMSVWGWARATMGPAFAQTGVPPRLVAHGLYRRVRHPMYAATAVAALGLALAGGRRRDFALWVFLCCVFLLRAWREERVLRRQFTDGWDAYARGTLGLLPPHPSRTSHN